MLRVAVARASPLAGLCRVLRRELPSSCSASRRCLHGSGSSSSSSSGGFVDGLLSDSVDSPPPLTDFYSLSGRKKITPGRVSPRLLVPETISWPPYAVSGTPPSVSSVVVLDKYEIEGMRKAGRLARQALRYAETLIRPGITTDEIDQKVHQFIVSHGAYPSTLNYSGFPKSCCTSVNEILAHGIPDSRRLLDGDIINVDVTVYLNGFHGDNALNFAVGRRVPESAKRLMRVTEECVRKAIAICAPGVPYSKIGETIFQHARAHGYNVFEDLTGHGVNRNFHTPPYTFAVPNNYKGEMKPGVTFTIEPILTEGGTTFTTWKDGWTLQASDGALNAQVEHTVLITDSGVEVLTEDV